MSWQETRKVCDGFQPGGGGRFLQNQPVFQSQIVRTKEVSIRHFGFIKLVSSSENHLIEKFPVSSSAVNPSQTSSDHVLLKSYLGPTLDFNLIFNMFGRLGARFTP